MSLIDQQVLGAPPPEGSTAGEARSRVAGCWWWCSRCWDGIISTGRVRGSDHDGLRRREPVTLFLPYERGSTFGNIVVTVPGTVLGGKLSSVVLWDAMTFARSEVQRDSFGTEPIRQRLERIDPRRRDSALGAKSTYALATIVGTWGQTTLKDSVDDCGSAAAPP